MSNKKRICFESTDKLHADLKIKLHYDNLKIKDFFNLIAQSYVDNNEHMLELVNKFKEKQGVSKKHRQQAKKMREVQQKTTSMYALESAEIENIFDIIEREHPEL